MFGETKLLFWKLGLSLNLSNDNWAQIAVCIFYNVTLRKNFLEWRFLLCCKLKVPMRRCLKFGYRADFGETYFFQFCLHRFREIIW